MRPDSPVHCEFTAAEANRCRTRNTAAVTSIPNASIAGNNAKARLERACDLCRRRKTKCDGPSAPDNICSNCLQNNQSCTYMCVYMHPLLSFHASHLLLAKPPARGAHLKRPFLHSHYQLSSWSELIPDTCSSYVSNLEDRLEKMEALLKRVRITRTSHYHLLLNPYSPSPSCVRRSILPNILARPSSGTPGSSMNNHRPRLLGLLFQKRVTQLVSTL